MDKATFPTGRAESVFQEIVTKSITMRGELLEALRDSDPDVFDQVQALIDDYEKADAWMVSMKGVDVQAPRPMGVGETLLNYKVESLLGRGGMSQVFLGSRMDGEFDQKVAIKCLDVHMGKVAQDKFRDEKRILGKLSHPNISKILDAGHTAQGQPFFVLEHIQGQEIHQYCRDQELDVRARVKLFLSVCGAISYAHRHLVVHRDLKPNNVLVDRDGKATILDFGIAKILDHEAQRSKTQHGFMTPEYASPEQIEGSEISVATDVYALGALLYELLSMQRPFHTQTGPAELMRQILLEEPRKPSERVRTQKENGQLASASLKGDLDAICLKALQKAPRDRYHSVDALIADLENYLKGFPVTALKNHIWVVGMKFLCRNWRRVSVLAAVLFLFVSLNVAYTRKLETERDRAQLETQKATQIKDFLVSIFQGSMPSPEQESQISAKELIDRSARNLKSDTMNDPGMAGELFGVVGTAYYLLGYYPESKSMYENAMVKKESHYPEEHEEVFRSKMQLARVLVKEGDYEKARSYLGDALKNTDAASPTILRAQLLEELANIDWLENDFDSALSRCAQVREILKKFPESAAFNAIDALETEGHCKDAKGDKDGALLAYEEAYETAVRIYGPSSLSAAKKLSSIGLIFLAKGQLKEAQDRIQRSVDIRSQQLEADHPTLANGQHFLGLIHKSLAQYDLSIEYYEQALETRKKKLGPNHPDTALTLNNLAIVYRLVGELEKSENLYRQVLAISKTNHGERHWRYALAQHNLGRVLYFMDRNSEAQKCYLTALEILGETLGEAHPYYAIVHNSLGSLALDQGDAPEARRYFEKARELLETHAGLQNPRTADVYLSLGRLSKLEGNLSSAVEWSQKGLDIRQAIYGVNDWRTVHAQVQCLGYRIDSGEPCLPEVLRECKAKTKGTTAESTIHPKIDSYLKSCPEE